MRLLTMLVAVESLLLLALIALPFVLMHRM